MLGVIMLDVILACVVVPKKQLLVVFSFERNVSQLFLSSFSSV